VALSASQRRAISHGIVYLIASLGAIAMVFPLLWTVSTSLKTLDQLVGTRIVLIPNPIAWENYVEIFKITPILVNLRNTMVIVACAEFGSLVMCSLVAYAFARIPFPGRNVMFALLLSGMMLPGVVQLIPLFVIFDRLGWINTFLPLVVPRFLAHNPFYIFLLRQFFMGIPQDLSDAARIDGCSEFSIWRRIVMPISAPALATVAIFTFQWAWNDFLYPLVYLGANRKLWTLALGLNSLRSYETANMTHLQMAFSVLMIIPVMTAFAFGQKHLVPGITFSGLKG
jgi:multiple sugar transport system permease protein